MFKLRNTETVCLENVAFVWILKSESWWPPLLYVTGVCLASPVVMVIILLFTELCWTRYSAYTVSIDSIFSSPQGRYDSFYSSKPKPKEAYKNFRSFNSKVRNFWPQKFLAPKLKLSTNNWLFLGSRLSWGPSIMWDISNLYEGLVFIMRFIVIVNQVNSPAEPLRTEFILDHQDKLYRSVSHRNDRHPSHCPIRK
jgi:hypothetical protein